MAQRWLLPMLRCARGTVVLALMVAFIPSPAIASDPSDVIVSGGALAVSPEPAVSDFVIVTLDGSARSTTSHLDPFMITDARGGGAGWHVTIQASPFREWNGTGYVPGGRSLPADSLAMPAPTVAAEGTDSPPPFVTSGPYAIDGSAVVAASAATGTGMGSYSFTPGDLVLTVPAGAYATTYRSEIAISVISGP